MSHEKDQTNNAISPTEVITQTAVVGALRPSRLDYSLASRQRFGHFVIVRPLGRGGMGEVYEAEDVDSGRLVALKRLRQSLGSDTDRARFLREGRLAASINHEHVVYVYGSEEIDGSPVITMELATGGSLKDRVAGEGPLPAAQAVDAILQVIAGLEATAAAGVLHRDVKPSNCFVGSDGSVKVGDFGLSISTRSVVESHLTVEGAVLGTPAFAPPEQVTGEPLDVRSDIYSTGATLYFLLAGQPPFVADSVAQVIGHVIKREPESPAALVPGLSQDLAWIVQRCLHKNPEHRFQSYDELRKALLPFSSQRSAPATLHSRLLASVADDILYSLPLAVVVPASRDLLSRQEGAHLTAFVFVSLIYFALLEGVWGASLGKLLLGIRVVRVDQQPIGLSHALQRVLVVMAATTLAPYALAIWFEVITGQRLGDGIVFIGFICLALLFVTARRANGFAGLQDLLTGTRVVERPASPARVHLPLAPRDQSIDARAPRIGAFLVVETLGATGTGQLVLGYDDVLRRHVWIHTHSQGAPEVTSERRAIARPGRLRWLSGRRTPFENWDAYDAPAGIAFTELVLRPQPWSLVRFLLYDVAVEAREIREAHENLPISVERVWVTERGTAVLLDFAVPGAPSSVARDVGVIELITRMALVALTADARVVRAAAVAAITPLPLHAYEFLTNLERGRLASLEALAAALRPLLPRPAALTRRLRIVHMAIVVSPSVAAMALAVPRAIGGGTVDFSILAVLAGLLLSQSLASIYSAAVFRGGLGLRLLGIAVVTREGVEASRILVFQRAMLAWLPALAFVAGVVLQVPWLVALAAAVIVAGLVSAALTPDRGVHDRLLGTRLVRR